MAVKIKIRRSTSVEWAASLSILDQGELGLDTTVNKLKAGNGINLWSALPFINILPSELSELAQDAVEAAITAGTGITKTYNDNANTITLAVDTTIANKTYVDTAVSGLGSTSATTYVPLNVVGNADGVASLDSDGKIPDSEIPAEITRNTLAQTLTNKTIGLGTGITSIAQYDNISGFFGQSNIAIYQAGLDRGGRISISTEGVISVVNSGIGYVSGIVTTSGGTRLIISVGGNTLSGTLAEFNAALTDGDFATQSYVSTAVSNLLDSAPETLNTLNELAAAINDDSSYAATITTALGLKAPLASPAFTGTVTGIDKTMVGLANVDNTTDALKPVSAATQTALDLKSNISDAAGPKAVAGASYTLEIIDSTKTLVTTATSGDVTITVPTNSSVNFPLGSTITLFQSAAGRIIVAPASGVTLKSFGDFSTFKNRFSFSFITLYQYADNSWAVVGDLTA